MIHDETTTEIEIPGKKTTPSNIVRVNFTQKVSLPPTAPMGSPFIQPGSRVKAMQSLPWWQRLDHTPWFLRLVAAVMILALSLLIF